VLFFGWWYVCIGLGFALLALRSWIGGVGRWGVGLRLLIAAGFLILGASTLRSLKKLG